MLPSSSVYNTVSTLRKFSIIWKFLERNFIVLNKCSCLIWMELVTSVLLLLDKSLLKLAFQILRIGSSLFKLNKHLALFRGKHAQSSFFFFIQTAGVLTFVLRIVLLHLLLLFTWHFKDKLLSQSLDFTFQFCELLNILCLILMDKFRDLLFSFWILTFLA